MAGSQDVGVCTHLFTISGSDTAYFAAVVLNAGEFFIEQHFSTTSHDLLAHGCDDLRKLVGSNMRMGVV